MILENRFEKHFVCIHHNYQENEYHHAREKYEEEHGEQSVRVLKRLVVEVPHQYSERRKNWIVDGRESFYLFRGESVLEENKKINEGDIAFNYMS